MGVMERGGTGGSRRRTPTNTLNSATRPAKEAPPGADGTVKTSTSIHLPAEQQMELARCVKAWADCKSWKAEEEAVLGRPLSFSEWAHSLDMSEAALRQQVDDGKAARELLIKTNINLIKSMAVKLYQRQERNENRLSVDDLVLEGTQGILKAAAKFDPNRNIRFTTYAVWWIRQAISLAIQTHSNTVRLPVLLQTRIKKVKDARARLYLDLEREPSHAEVGAYVGLPAEKVKRIRRSGRSRHFLSEDDYLVTGLAMDLHNSNNNQNANNEDRGDDASLSPLSEEGMEGHPGAFASREEERRKLEAFKEAVLQQLKQGDREIVQSRWETFQAAKEQPAVTGRKLRRIQGELKQIVLQKDFEDRRDVFSSMRLCMA